MAADDGRAWSELATLDQVTRERSMHEHLMSVLALDDAPRLQALRDMITAEYALDEPSLRPFTISRLRTWVAIAQDDVERARLLARGYDTVFDGLPAEMAMRRARVVQTVAKSDFSPAEVEALFEVIPSLLRQVPRASTEHFARPAVATTAGTTAWWKFWQRSATPTQG